MNMPKILAIIPARSGSKGLKDKNIIELNGIPLLAYPIIEASKSKYVNDIILSTDSQKYADIGIKYGARVPSLRPKNLSTDKAVRSDVISHVIKNNPEFDIIVYLEPTSPLTTCLDIDLAIESLLKNQKARSIVSISESPTHHPEYAVIIEDNDLIKPLLKNSFSEIKINRQDLDKVYFFDGSLYISYTDTFIKEKEFYHKQTMGLILDESKAVEIDNEFDLKIVKLLIDERQ